MPRFSFPSGSGKRRAIILATLGVLALVGLVAVFALRPFDKPPETVTVMRRDLTETVEVSGVAESNQRVVLKAESGGRIAALVAAENQRVAKGAPLLRIDDEQARLNLNQATSNASAASAQAEAQLEAARRSWSEVQSRQAVTLTNLGNQIAKARSALSFLESDVARTRTLAAEGAVSRQMLDQQEQQLRQARLDLRIAEDNLARARTGTEVVAARNALATAETAVANARKQGAAAIAIAKKALANTVVSAPFAGTVTDWTVEVGDQIAPGTPLGTFQDLEDLRVRLPVDELDLPRMRIGGPVELIFDAYPEAPYQGKIVEISRASVEGVGNVRVFPVEVRFDNRDRRIRPGMSGDANVIVRKLSGVLTVPVGAVSRAGTAYTVQVLNARNKPETVTITPGVTTLEHVEVRAGLKEGDRVIYAAAKPK